MTDNLDYYRTLGLPADATRDEIRRAFRRRALRYHPDVNPGPEAEARFKTLRDAYSVLSDGDLRAAYDRARRTGEDWHHPDSIVEGAAPADLHPEYADRRHGVYRHARRPMSLPADYSVFLGLWSLGVVVGLYSGPALTQRTLDAGALALTCLSVPLLLVAAWMLWGGLRSAATVPTDLPGMGLAMLIAKARRFAVPWLAAAISGLITGVVFASRGSGVLVVAATLLAFAALVLRRLRPPSTGAG